MEAVFFILIKLFTCSCILTSSDEKVVVTGERIPKSNFEAGELKEVKRKEGESTVDVLMRSYGIGHYPKMGTFSSCSELLSLLRAKNIEILSIEAKKVIVPTNGEVLFEYGFEQEECPVDS